LYFHVIVDFESPWWCKVGVAVAAATKASVHIATAWQARVDGISLIYNIAQ
jgi:hypothetical protein